MSDSLSEASPPPKVAFRFHIKDLFFLCTWSAVVVWCLVTTGPAFMRVAAQLFLILLLSGVALFWFHKRDESSIRVLDFWNILVLLVTLCAGSITAPIYALFLLIACHVIKARSVQSYRTVLYTFCLLSIISISISIGLGIQRQHILAKERLHYPVIDLRQRLAYESSKPKLPAAPSLASPDQAFHYWGNRRLEKIHAETALNFMMAQGFGHFRMDDITYHIGFELPSQLIPFKPESTVSRDSQGDSPETPFAARHTAYAESFTQGRLNRVFVIDPTRKAIGKVEHGFGRYPYASSTIPITRLELVSLHRYGEPRCYVSEYLPDMAELRKNEIATRPLDDFESQSLEKLWTDQNVVIRQDPGATRMLGALRASQDCLECHAATKGELLGAFTYTWDNVP